ncbi:MAG: LysE family translocator [Mycobacteriales bacterium]|nr:LysE family translocator [Mycobacteriales bacterium]
MDTTTLAAFAGAVFLLALTPGPDTALALRWTLVSGRRQGWLVALGSMTGVTVHLTAALLGVSAVLATSATAFTALKLAGAVYLTVLGLRLLLTRATPEGEAPPPRRTGRVLPESAYLQGVLSGTLNPKTALFFLTLLPQFVDVSSTRAWELPLLGLVALVVMAVFWVGFLALVGGAQSVVRRPRVQQWVERVTGGVFVALGARLAVAAR